MNLMQPTYRNARVLSVAALLCAAAVTAVADTSPNAPQDPNLVTDARRCGSLAETGQRLACYDRLFRIEQVGTASVTRFGSCGALGDVSATAVTAAAHSSAATDSTRALR